MNITILQGAFFPVPPVLGGAVEKLWFALSKEFVRKGNSVVHISRSYTNMMEEEWMDGVHYKRVKGYNSPSSGVYLKWLDLLYSKRASKKVDFETDVVVTNTFWSPVLLPGRLQTRCMVDVERMPKGQMMLYKKAGRLRANSSPVAEAIRKETAFPQHKQICTIPNPIPFAKFSDIDFSEKKPVILFVGRIHPEKGVDLLLEATQKLSKDWKVKIIGSSDVKEGGGGSTYLNRLKSINSAANIEFIGPVYDIARLNQYYAEASIFVYPSVAEKGETFGLAPLEAMAWGCVPVVSEIACFKDFIHNERNGLIFDHRDKNSVELLSKTIERLQFDNKLRMSLSRKALEVRNTHSVSTIATLFLEEFERMISENSPLN